MSKVADVSEPASELERLIVDLAESGLLVFVFGVGWWTAHLTGAPGRAAPPRRAARGHTPAPPQITPIQAAT
jgi:hypothetical protein